MYDIFVYIYSAGPALRTSSVFEMKKPLGAITNYSAVIVFFEKWFFHLLACQIRCSQGDLEATLEKIQRSRGSMTQVLQLQEMPEIEPDEPELHHMRIEKLVPWCH